jgi:ribonuclease Z
VLHQPYIFIACTHFYSNASGGGSFKTPAPVLEALEAAKSALGLARFEPFPVHHVSLSTGLALEGAGANGAPWKVVFSGDTRPCPAVVAAARGGTLLIHEATFEDEMATDAKAKRHSTLSEALGVARDAGVYRTVLTHFSGRYPQIPVLAPAEGESGGAMGGAAGAGGGGGTTPLTAMVGRSVAVGFDFMAVNLADLPWLPLIVPACDALLREEGFVTGDDAEGEDEGKGKGAGGE